MNTIAVMGTPDPAQKDVYEYASRGIVYVTQSTLLMVTTDQYGEYNFPGGRADEGESAVATLIREMSEETGFAVDESTVREAGLVEVVHRRSKRFGQVNLHQMNLFYFCNAEPVGCPHLDPGEALHGVRAVEVSPEQAIQRNAQLVEERYRFWMARDLLVLRWLQDRKNTTL